MKCPPCHHQCNEARDCDAHRSHPYLAAIAVALLCASCLIAIVMKDLPQ